MRRNGILNIIPLTFDDVASPQNSCEESHYLHKINADDSDLLHVTLQEQTINGNDTQ